MAKQRYINTFFWDDPYIEDLDPAGKLLFIYLITTPLTNIAGSFEITIKKMADHTGLGRDTIGDLRRTFATRSLENGADAMTVSRMLGHTSLRMIPRYARSIELMQIAVDKLASSPTIPPTAKTEVGKVLKLKQKG